jgi:Zn-dependent peptidase ImmA (M78 family)/transcriptional regulator with XRE-family HTH domain
MTMPLTPSRLMLARQRRGLTRVALSRASSVSERSLQGYENGTQQPGREIVNKLADTLRFPPSFFSGSDVEEIPTEAISFRALSKVTATQRDAARGAGRIALMLSEWINERFSLPTPDVPHLPSLAPDAAAEVVRARWGLGEGPVGNMIHLLEAHGVRVFSLVNECRSVDAFSFMWNETPVVVLNTGKSGERGRFDAAHELGHLILHSEHRVPHGVEAEQQANAFAASFLMPRAAILGQQLHNATLDRVLVAKKYWRIAAMAMTHRLHELDLLTEWGYRNTCVNLSRRGYRSTEPGGIPRETSQLLDKVVRTMRSEGTTPAHIAADLKITVSELNTHMFGLVPTALAGGASKSPPMESRLRLVSNEEADRPASSMTPAHRPGT